VQVVERDAHGSGGFWRFAELEFNTVATAPMEEEQIELRTAVSGPKEILGRTEDFSLKNRNDNPNIQI